MLEIWEPNESWLTYSSNRGNTRVLMFRATTKLSATHQSHDDRPKRGQHDSGSWTR
jgi:hypothetical protein